MVVDIIIIDDDYTYLDDTMNEVTTALYGVFKGSFDEGNRENLIYEYRDYFYLKKDAIEWAKSQGYKIKLTKTNNYGR